MTSYTLASLVRTLLVSATLLHPFMPTKMVELVRRLGVGQVPTLEEALELDLAGRTVHRGDPLFPRPDLR